MSLSYDSIGQVCITCLGSGPQVNAPCKVTGNNSVGACLDGDPIDGVVLAKRINLLTVAIKGFVTVPYAGDNPVLGYCPLAAAGNGKVKVLEGAREFLVIHFDSVNKNVTFCL